MRLGDPRSRSCILAALAFNADETREATANAKLPVPVESNLDEIAIGMKELFFVDKVEIADIDRGNLREII
jgi:hypothetical protein